MKRPNQVTALVFMLFSSYMVWEAMRLKFYTSLGPGPGFFPFWVSLMTGVLAAGMFYQATFQRSDPMPVGFFASRAAYLRIAAMTVAVIGVVALMDLIGFRLIMLAFLAFLLMALGKPNPLVAVPVALGGSFGIYYVFTQLLKISLPIGILGI